MKVLMNSYNAVLRRCLFAFLCVALSAVAMHSASFAAECDDGTCKGIKIINETGYNYSIKFLLCCNGELKKTDCYPVPVGSSSFDFSDDGCTILKWGFCNRLTPRFCYKWYEDECVLLIYNCE